MSRERPFPDNLPTGPGTNNRDSSFSLFPPIFHCGSPLAETKGNQKFPVSISAVYEGGPWGRKQTGEGRRGEAEEQMEYIQLRGCETFGGRTVHFLPSHSSHLCSSHLPQ